MTRLETAQMLREHDNFIILTHRRPDGDTTGCAAGLCLGLRALGKSAWVLRNRQLTPKLAPFAEVASAVYTLISLALAGMVNCSVKTSLMTVSLPSEMLGVEILLEIVWKILFNEVLSFAVR